MGILSNFKKNMINASYSNNFKDFASQKGSEYSYMLSRYYFKNYLSTVEEILNYAKTNKKIDNLKIYFNTEQVSYKQIEAIHGLIYNMFKLISKSQQSKIKICLSYADVVHYYITRTTKNGNKYRIKYRQHQKFMEGKIEKYKKAVDEL